MFQKFIKPISFALALSVMITPAFAKTRSQSLTLYSDSTTQKSKQLTFPSSKKVVWKTVNAKIASVKNGLVTAQKPGNTTITAQAGKKHLQYRISVKKVALNKEGINLKSGESQTIRLIGDQINHITSTNTDIATVTSNGKVTAVKPGSTDIMFFTRKRKYTLQVNVIDAKLKVIRQGKCGQNVYYSLTNDGTLTIFGKGKMYDHQIFKKDKNKIRKINILKGVTSIGNWAFSSCSNLTAITMPDELKSIGKWAFYNCKKLNVVSIPYSVTEIKEGTFSRCTNMTGIGMPVTLKRIENYAFAHCSKMIDITIPMSVTYVGKGVFNHCSKLQTIFYSGSAKLSVPKNITIVTSD